MKNYVVRVYRVFPDDLDSVSGLIEDPESGHKKPFHGINELQTLLAHYIDRGQLDSPDLVVPEKINQDNIAV
jgi:hypothetical protein